MPAVSSRHILHRKCENARGLDKIKFCLQSTTCAKIADPSCDLSRYLLLSERSTLCKLVGKLNCAACELALEPVEVRKEKVIMLAEAYTIVSISPPCFCSHAF
jgi:hypothetical protein